MKFLSRVLNKKEDHTTKISEFVRYASDKEKEALIREITRQANEDQRRLVEQYHQAQKKAA